MNRYLRNLIAATIAEFPNGSPDEIAQIVADNTSSRDMQTYYRELLLTPVRSVAAEIRRQERPPRPKPEPRQPSKPAPTPQPSVKLADRRSWWQQQLASEIRVGAGAVKPLADCTAEDLRMAIKECDAAIGRHEERMGFLNRLISQMVTRRVGRVRELPEQPRDPRSA